MTDVIKINRAPVLTLWAAVIAERLGYDWEEALTLGRAVAGLNAYSKGVSLGLYKPAAEGERKRPRKPRPGEIVQVDLLHRAVPVMRAPEGLRALSKEQPISPASVDRYLQGKFRDRLDDARKAMERVAQSWPKEDLAEKAYALYERFRPVIPAGARGWGALGELNLDFVLSLARK